MVAGSLDTAAVPAEFLTPGEVIDYEILDSPVVVIVATVIPSTCL